MAKMDLQIKKTAIAYFKASKEAEDSFTKYTRIKYDAEIGYDKRTSSYNSMIDNLTNLSKCETTYKMTVDEANNYIQEFRREMIRGIRSLRDLEEPRCETIHSVINQFVVFEQSAEMNNKYDLGNFAKLLESFTP